MPGPDRPGGDVPPGIPPEYAEAYRRGFQRGFDESASLAEAAKQQATKEQAAREQAAREQAGAEPSGDGAAADRAAADGPAAGGEPSDQEETPGWTEDGDEPTTRLDAIGAAAFRSAPAEDPADWHPPPREDRRRYLAPALLAGLALLLLLSAYGLGRLFSSEVSDVDAAGSEQADGVSLGGGGAAGPQQGGSPQSGPAEEAGRYDGPVTAAAIGGASVSCQSESSVDAGGNPVTYEPANIYDGDLTTAWRCDGGGSGERVEISLADRTEIGEVGMVPGYAKTDARSGADRYAENNRITRVRWHFDDGTTVVQRLDGSAGNRQLQTVRVPETVSGRVVIEILDSVRGPRNTVAISEVRVGAVAG